MLKWVNDEPELPGEMPDEIYQNVKKNKGAMAELLKITVRKTKEGILNRIIQHTKTEKP